MFRMGRLSSTSPKNRSSVERRFLNSSSPSSTGSRMGRNVLFLTAAAAISTNLYSRVDGFTIVRRQPRPSSGLLVTPPSSSSLLSPSQGGAMSRPSNLPTPSTSSTTTRLYSTQKNNEDGLLKKLAKKLLPRKWFQSEEEQKAEMVRQQVKDNVKGGLQELLKDAPLPVRMMGRMISPLLSSMASNLSESLAEQQETIEAILDDSRAYIIGDDVALQLLGEPIKVGAPFSQSSSTTIINGQKTVNIAIGFPVEGSRASGMAQAQATDKGINRLVIQVDGRQIDVSLSKRGGGGSPSSRVGKNHRMRSSSDDDDNIIEAEIIEKEVKK